MNSRYKIFVVFHRDINPEYYQEDVIKDYTFVNVNPANNIDTYSTKYDVVNQFEFKHYFPLGKWYTESEVIYNIYRNKHLWQNLNFIGFSQYDIDTSPLTHTILDQILSQADHINLQPHLFDVDYSRKVVMDPKKPNRKNGKGLNCYDAILAEYNKFYGTTFTINNLQGKTLNLCSSFVLSKKLFEDMMTFIGPIIESGHLDIYDTSHKNRIQGGYLERYYALWLALNPHKTTVLELNHHFIESVKGNTISNKILDKFRKWF